MHCERCGALGTIFECERWTKTNGECCPAGTIVADCPGRSLPCPCQARDDESDYPMRGQKKPVRPL